MCLSQGFDEYMNVVLDDAEEVNVKRRSRKPVGRILLKGDNITLISAATDDESTSADVSTS
jgi:small nuclear ribonucleoprotein E